MDEIYNVIKPNIDREEERGLRGDQRSPLGASGPTNFVHKVHVGFDPRTGAFTVSSLCCSPFLFPFLHDVDKLRGYLTNGTRY